MTQEQYTTSFLTLIAITLLAGCAPSSPLLLTPEQAYDTKPAYNYPISDPYAATVITLPADMKVDYSSVPEPEDKKITLFKDRPIPQGFWYQHGLNYSELLQTSPAPLVYIIPGIGADAHATVMRTIANILYTAGYSVVLLPSPGNPNFIINASENNLPGNPVQDARDIYRLMLAINEEVSHKTIVNGHILVGYSLGGWQAAYTAKLDSEKKQLNFSKVLLINPPLNLYSSVHILDSDLNRDLPHGMNDADHFIKNIITRLSNVSQTGEAFDFTNEDLRLDIYNKTHPSDDQLATIIGLSFRLTAADMVFTSDVMRHSGYIFPKNKSFTISVDLNPYMAVALRTSFSDYLNEVLYEEQHAKNPELTKQDFVSASSLESIASYISHNHNMGMITNRDDIILASGELDKLVLLFGSNAVVFPSGGHMGNIALPAMAYQIVTFMKK